MSENRDLEIQVSSTTLGYTGEGGKVGAVTALVEGILSKEAYTDIVVKNAKEFKEVTEQEIPEAKFGVSVLASAVNPEKMKEFIRSVDYPYSIDWGMKFLKEKYKKVSEEGYKGLGKGVALGQELAYALLQAKSENEQRKDTSNTLKYMELNPVRIRTCIETVSIPEKIKNIKMINLRESVDGREIIWVLEPNKKVGDGTLSSFLQTYEKIQKEYPYMSFGIDLDMGGLPQEDNLLKVLDRMDSNTILPLFISLSGQEYTESNVRTHLPLGKNIDMNRNLGEWLYRKQVRGEKVPGLVVETFPTQDNVLKDYSEFIESLKKGL